MPGTIYRFDMKALCDALEAGRQDRGLNWPDLAAEINVPFRGTPSLPISVGTIRTMRSKRSVTSAVVLQILRWLGRSPESFLTERDVPPAPDEALPDPGPSRILRFDTRAMYAALDAERRALGMTWTELARDLPGFTASMLTNLAAGPLIGFPRVMLLTQWLDRPAAHFVRGRSR